MNSKDYVANAIQTDVPEYSGLKERMYKAARLLHAAMGITTECGELMDVLKKYTIYNKPIDTVNLQEECGDLFWYIALLADEVGFTFEDTFEKNIAKLRARYPNRFTEFDALNRDLNKEREILEK